MTYRPFPLLLSAFVLILLYGSGMYGDGMALAQPRYFGAFTYGGVWQGMEPVRALEAKLGRRLDIVHWFMNWEHAWDETLLRSAAQEGRLPLISWQPHRQRVADIGAGDHDAYIRAWAEGAARYDGPVYLRPFPEMNGDWVTWNGEPEAFRQAWRRVVRIFHEAGALNVFFVWSPNATDAPRSEANRMEHYYPGEAYVDVLALDGYNWGDSQNWSAWNSFEAIFAVPYARVAALGRQPIWLAEFASAETGGDKAAWVRDMLASRAFPRIEALVWFDQNKETDWRIDSSSESMSAFREALSSPTQLAAR